MSSGVPRVLDGDIWPPPEMRLETIAQYGTGLATAQEMM
jgi:hypothetical protein